MQELINMHSVRRRRQSIDILIVRHISSPCVGCVLRRPLSLSRLCFHLVYLPRIRQHEVSKR